MKTVGIVIGLIVLIFAGLFATPAVMAWVLVTVAGASFWPALWTVLIWNLVFGVVIGATSENRKK